MVKVISGIFGAFINICIARGILIWLNKKNIYPEKWIADMLGYSESVLVEQAIFWILLGLIGVAGLFFGPCVLEKGKLLLQKKNQRIPFSEFLIEAEKLGWLFKGDSHHILDICDGVRQAAIDGEIQFWGRRTHPNDLLTKKEPLIEIPRSHWSTHNIDACYCLNLDNQGMALSIKEDNLSCHTEDCYHDKGYADLHIDSGATAWLKRCAKRYMGMNRTRETTRNTGEVDKYFNKKIYFESEELEIYKIAYLSFNLEPDPYNNLPSKVNARNSTLKKAISKGELKAQSKGNEINAYAIVNVKDFGLYANNSKIQDFINVADQWKLHHPRENVDCISLSSVARGIYDKHNNPDDEYRLEFVDFLEADTDRDILSDIAEAVAHYVDIYGKNINGTTQLRIDKREINFDDEKRTHYFSDKGNCICTKSNKPYTRLGGKVWENVCIKKNDFQNAINAIIKYAV